MPYSEPEVNAIGVDQDTWVEILERAATKAAAALIESQGQGGPVVMKRAWVYRRGEAYYVGYREPGGRKVGKSYGPGKEGRRLAVREADRIHAELVTGTFDQNIKKPWTEFRAEYEQKILASKAHETRRLTIRSLNNFERLCKPGRVSTITTKTIDTFIAARRIEKQDFQALENPKRPRARVEPKIIKTRTVNADLRAIKSALRIAAEWNYLKELPKIRFLPEPETLPTYVTPEDFDKLYEAAHVATKPDVQGVLPADWWRALLAVGYMTGLRIGELLALRRDQVDLDNGTARYWNQKANREDLVPVHPAAVEALRALRSFSDVFFPWPHHRNTIWREWDRIQAAAGLADKYTPHALRRAFGTMNAGRVGGPKALQFLMRHRNGQTTMKFYVNPCEGIQEAVNRLYVPEKLRTGTGG